MCTENKNQVNGATEVKVGVVAKVKSAASNKYVKIGVGTLVVSGLVALAFVLGKKFETERIVDTAVVVAEEAIEEFAAQ